MELNWTYDVETKLMTFILNDSIKYVATSGGLRYGKKVAKAYYGAYLECLKGKAVEGDRRAIDQKIEKITCTLCEHGVSLLVEQ